MLCWEEAGVRKASNYLADLICIIMLASIPREISNVTAAGLLWLISYLVFPNYWETCLVFFFFPLEHFVSCGSGLFPLLIYTHDTFTGEWDIIMTHSLQVFPVSLGLSLLSPVKGKEFLGPWHTFVPISTAPVRSSVCWSALNLDKYLRATCSGAVSRYNPSGFLIRGQISESTSPCICFCK